MPIDSNKIITENRHWHLIVQCEQSLGHDPHCQLALWEPGLFVSLSNCKNKSMKKYFKLARGIRKLHSIVCGISQSRLNTIHSRLKMKKLTTGENEKRIISNLT